jgi:hypothetical protein
LFGTNRINAATANSQRCAVKRELQHQAAERRAERHSVAYVPRFRRLTEDKTHRHQRAQGLARQARAERVDQRQTLRARECLRPRGSFGHLAEGRHQQDRGEAPTDTRDRLLDALHANDRQHVGEARCSDYRQADRDRTLHCVISDGASGPGLVSSSVSWISIHHFG